MAARRLHGNVAAGGEDGGVAAAAWQPGNRWRVTSASCSSPTLWRRRYLVRHQFNGKISGGGRGGRGAWLAAWRRSAAQSGGVALGALAK